MARWQERLVLVIFVADSPSRLGEKKDRTVCLKEVEDRGRVREGEIGANGRVPPLSPWTLRKGSSCSNRIEAASPRATIRRSYDPDPRSRDSGGKRCARGAGDAMTRNRESCLLVGMSVERVADNCSGEVGGV